MKFSKYFHYSKLSNDEKEPSFPSSSSGPRTAFWYSAIFGLGLLAGFLGTSTIHRFSNETKPPIILEGRRLYQTSIRERHSILAIFTKKKPRCCRHDPSHLQIQSKLLLSALRRNQFGLAGDISSGGRFFRPSSHCPDQGHVLSLSPIALSGKNPEDLILESCSQE